jgi:RNA polymerase sporulation-specific sigma factor
MSDLAEKNYGLAVHVAQKFLNTGVEFDELKSSALLGLVKAAKAYDPGKGAKFATFAVFCMSNEIKIYLRNTRKHIGLAYLDSPVGEDGKLLRDVVSNGADLADQFDRAEMATAVRDSVRQLPERIQKVVTCRYGLDGADEMGRRQIGETLGLSKSYIYRLEKQAIGKLAETLARGDAK